MKATWCPAAPPRSASIFIFGEDSSFWINLGINALAKLWILQLTLRVLRMRAHGVACDHGVADRGDPAFHR
jgi:hypothetical protein